MYLANHNVQNLLSDGLENMYIGPYLVVDVKYPNVKIRKGNDRFSWIHLNDCKIVPMSSESLEFEHEHEVSYAERDSSGEVDFDTNKEPQDRETILVENLVGETVRSSTR